MKPNAVFFVVLQLAAALAVLDSELASSCIYYMKNFNWDCGDKGQANRQYRCRCQNIDWVGSVANCIEMQSTNTHEISHAWKHLSTQCLQKSGLRYTVDRLAEYLQNASQYMQAAPANISIRIETPISPDTSTLKKYQASFRDLSHHVFKAQWLGWGLVFYWAAYIGYLTAANILWVWFRVSLFPKPVRQWYQKYMLKPTFILGLLIWDVLLATGFVAQAILSTSLSYTVTRPNMYIDDAYRLTLELLANRSAVLSVSLMPVVYVFGLRNNPFCWTTGLPQATFIRYHKVVAIVMAIEILVHSIAWSVYAVVFEGYADMVLEAYWRWGMVATTVLILMLSQSVSCIRNAMYETFLVIHKVFGSVFIVSMWQHCSLLGWMGWVYATIALATYERVARLFKTFFINGGFQKITINVIDSRVIKVNVAKSALHDTFYQPGSHVFVSFYHWPIWHRCWQSHPFTIICSPVENQGVFVMYIRIKKGTTAALAKLKGDDKGTVCMWLLIEGPYGNGVSKFQANEQLVGIAGGLGVCALLPTFHQNPQDSMLYWSVNNTTDIAYLDLNLRHLISQGCQVHVYLTRNEKEKPSTEEVKWNYVTVLGERPRVAEWVTESIKRGICMQKTDTYVLSCGPGLMDGDVQRSVSENTRVDLHHNVHFHRENYQW
ncbi:hypothetical protein METBIDRAFT_68148 [Metschnikowia bicuspidata var. bicuspidata NRRL YB-4993]|uniref:FAD-binding FR-type domain-containing protein n=1 Tax=Metschnikowia bicuspidata var. bicuspidata NRRL YB-4993 TaxID=869754 RepID=A0A1A0HE77_9ASCO|nr:hypothetical protein METBIDRAFT_68148 [Metschnikowia bicuspidata var. bicuspidata NRRL YB-4993]OBA22414.1 hypothetical protein METBIDRAFT_68148 [Metschnikowia bicuspidata var. bicuspidata NRRL YB-4993]